MTETQSPDVHPQPYAAVPPSGGAAGSVALIVGLALVAIGVVQQVVGLFLPQIMAEAGLSTVQVGLVYSGISIVTGVIAIVGVVAGVIGIQPGRARGRLAAAAGLALSVAHVVSVIVGLVAPLAYGAIHGLSGAF